MAIRSSFFPLPFFFAFFSSLMVWTSSCVSLGTRRRRFSVALALVRTLFLQDPGRSDRGVARLRLLTRSAEVAAAEIDMGLRYPQALRSGFLDQPRLGVGEERARSLAVDT